MHVSIWQVLFLALLQGVTELFPISSLGHTIILPALFGWGDLVRNEQFLPLIVALHLGTSIALVLYFWRDWLGVGRALVHSIKEGQVRRGTQEWVGWLILLGCIPAGLLGVMLETPLKRLFATPIVAASFLIINGIILCAGELLWRSTLKRQSEAGTGTVKVRFLASLSWKEAVLIGLFQSLALIPGISRSGVTMVAGLGLGLSHEDAARYSFLLGTPLIGAAAVLEVPQLFGLAAPVLLLVLLGMLLSGVAAFLSTKFLLRYFESSTLYPFAGYCCGAGILALSFFLLLHS